MIQLNCKGEHKMAKEFKATITVSKDDIQYEFENGTLQDMYTIACYVTARYMLQGLAMGMTKEEMKKQLEKITYLCGTNWS